LTNLWKATLRHPMMYYHTEFGDHATNNIKDIGHIYLLISPKTYVTLT